MFISRGALPAPFLLRKRAINPLSPGPADAGEATEALTLPFSVAVVGEVNLIWRHHIQSLDRVCDSSPVAGAFLALQPEAASRMLFSSETTLPSFPSLTTSSRHFIIFVYQSPSNPSASAGPLLPPPLLPLTLSPASVRRRFLIWSRLRHLRLWSVISVGVFHVLSSKARVPRNCLSSFEQKTYRRIT